MPMILRGLRLQHEGGKVWCCERRTHRAKHLAAIGGDHGGRIALQRVAERVVVGDEEPAVAAALDHGLRRAHRKGVRIEHPLDRIGRAELAVEVGRSGRVRDEKLLLLAGDGLHRKADRRNRHVDDQIDLLGIVPAPRDCCADVGLQLMIADDDADGFAEHRAAEVVDRHLRRSHRALAGRRRGRAVHVGQHADFHDVVGDLRECCGRRQHGGGERCKRRQESQKHYLSSQLPAWPWRIGLQAGFIWSLLQLFWGPRQRASFAPRPVQPGAAAIRLSIPGSIE